MIRKMADTIAKPHLNPNRWNNLLAKGLVSATGKTKRSVLKTSAAFVIRSKAKLIQ